MVNAIKISGYIVELEQIGHQEDMEGTVFLESGVTKATAWRCSHCNSEDEGWHDNKQDAELCCKKEVSVNSSHA